MIPGRNRSAIQPLSAARAINRGWGRPSACNPIRAVAAITTARGPFRVRRPRRQEAWITIASTAGLRAQKIPPSRGRWPHSA